MSFLGHIAKKMNCLYASPDCNVVGLFHAGILGLTLPELPTVKQACFFMVWNHLC